MKFTIRVIKVDLANFGWESNNENGKSGEHSNNGHHNDNKNKEKKSHL